MLPRIRLAVATLPVLCATLLLNAGAQTPGVPPFMVQVPFISVGAGDISSVTGLAVTTPASACTGYANAGTNNYGDGCPANQAGVSTPWGVAVDRWGNVYFSDEGHIYVRVIYAGATTVNGVANPATAMIAAANTSLAIPGTLVAGDVYALAGGLTAAAVSRFRLQRGWNSLSVDGSGCPATDSYIKGPYSPTVDSAGNVFIPDKSNSLVYVVLANATGLAAQLVVKENASSFSTCTTTNNVLGCTGAAPKVGYIYQIAGKGGGYVDAVIANNSGEIHEPYSIAVDSSENLYFGDNTNNAVRMVNGPNTTSGGVGPGFIHTIAGSGCTSSGCTALTGAPSSGVAAVGAAFVAPGPVVVDGSGNVYVGDADSRARPFPQPCASSMPGARTIPGPNLIYLETGSLIAGCRRRLHDRRPRKCRQLSESARDCWPPIPMSPSTGFKVSDSIATAISTSWTTAAIVELAEVNTDTGTLTFLFADGEASSAAKYTVGDYCSNNSGTGSGPTALDEYGDGCPAPQSNSSNAAGNIGVDLSGNLYFADNGDNLVRKLTFNGSFPATTVGSTATTQNLAFLLEIGTTGDTVSTVSPANVSTQGITTGSEFTDPGTGDTCSSSTTLKGLASTSSNTAGTVCVVPIAFKPVKAGARSGAVQISGTISSISHMLGTDLPERHRQRRGAGHRSGHKFYAGQREARPRAWRPIRRATSISPTTMARFTAHRTVEARRSRLAAASPPRAR